MPKLDYQTVGLLATGTELIQGDILNTNGQAIAHQLKDHSFELGTHVIVSDAETDIEAALAFLLNHYNVVIITGGLGPTSDDRTRYALSKVIQQPLVFDATSWQRIVARLQHYGITIHESNRQQALFPEQAQIFPNENGTAAGCAVNFSGKLIYMLPGPPHECLPMFKQFVLPHLLQHQAPSQHLNFKWLLFGVIEAEIAALLDELVKPYPVVTGYRLCSPYLEFKIKTQPNPQLEQLLTDIERAIAPYWINAENLTAAELLRRELSIRKHPLSIYDTATGGLLETTLTIPETKNRLIFSDRNDITPSTLQVQISGLQEYWQEQSDAKATLLEIVFTYQNQQYTVTAQLPYRPKYILGYAVEYSCQEILNFLKRVKSQT